jgi:hypothetical protein
MSASRPASRDKNPDRVVARNVRCPAQGRYNVGETITFRFGPRGSIEMKVLELAPAKRVRWQVVAGPDAWIGTKVNFELAQDDEFTRIPSCLFIQASRLEVPLSRCAKSVPIGNWR